MYPPGNRSTCVCDTRVPEYGARGAALERRRQLVLTALENCQQRVPGYPGTRLPRVGYRVPLRCPLSFMPTSWDPGACCLATLRTA
eukprot:3381774-Rhodomonas_salina.1